MHRPPVGPPGLPASLVKQFREYQVPMDKEKLYKELHAKYSQLSGKDHALKVTVGGGTTEFNIDLP
jgi:hypothetical protein